MTASLRRVLAAGLTASLASAGCAVGPNYARPAATPPPAFKESPQASGWTPSQPMDGIDKGAWWRVFDDPVLDGLEQRVRISNQNVAAAEAAYRQAQALTAVDRASFFPALTLNASSDRSKSGGSGRTGIVTGGGSTTTTTGTGTTGTGISGTGTTSTGTGVGSTIVAGGDRAVSSHQLSAGASWTPDLWGRIRRQVESDRAGAEASAADLANAALSAQAELAVDYFNLRVLDEQQRLYDDTVAAYRRSLRLTQNQYDAGVVARADVIAAEGQLLAAEASAADTGVARAQDEHAIAMLIGIAPSALAIAPVPLKLRTPTAPAGLPSELLQRRPDIASAERALQQASALIGVQVAAYFPDITLTGEYGFSSTALSHLFAASSTFWSYGGNLAETALDFGARRGRVREARAVYDQRVAQYRQTVLVAFQGVEDQLAALRALQSEAALRAQSLVAERQAEQLALNQYRAGIVNYTTVVTAEANALAAAQAALNVASARQTASVTLIEDLGGGWTVADLPRG